ncbi:MBL fold metallo-hydrolase [Chitinophaga japonensis]|uniref:Metallo-beta-lactamase superfamily protein n=1 Tax=Chitinophaga japonensis TaxID=104662 RepID=A0A562TDX5_CHIJA|nr:MBL fold metallo-hydrolase [Chitinophaga japonensis]TWI91583.1 metallo-beta-lactamase superfamily protein [Chitinophaga japonensis]
MFYICTTCGIQYNDSPHPPAHCPVCEDERQYVGPGGQSWTTLEQVNRQHRNIIELTAPGLYAIYTTPSFAIGQRAYLLVTPGGNILWDCIANLDASTIDIIQKLGGIRAIALSHPHYFSTIVEWSHAFDHAPVYVHAQDARWLGRTDPVIQLWEGGAQPLWDGIRLVLCGGHFPGGNILHWPGGDEGRGALLVGDVIQVCPDQRTVSFMYSYPNYIPLPKKDILQVQAAVQPLDYNALYGAFGRNIRSSGREAVAYSLERYLRIYES